jgi:hypothetical protein
MPVLSLLLKHINPGNAVNQVNTAVHCPIDMCGTNVAPLTQLTSLMSPLTQPMSMLPHNRGSVKESLQCKDINQVNIPKYLFPDAAVDYGAWYKPVVHCVIGVDYAALRAVIGSQLGTYCVRVAYRARAVRRSERAHVVPLLLISKSNLSINKF